MFRAQVLLACSLFALSTRAAESRAAPHIVEIHVDGRPAMVTQTRTVATEILLRISVVPVVLADDAVAPSYPTPGEPFVRAYFDFRASAPRLVIVDGKTQRELDRRVLPEGASPETSVEAVVHVLYMVVESLLDEPPAQPAESAPTPAADSEPARAAPPTPTPAAPSPAPSEPPRRERDDGLGLEAGALFRTLYLGGPHLQPGGGLVLDARMDRAEPRVSIAGSFAAHAPMQLSFDDASVSLLPWTVSLTPSLQGKLGHNVLGLVGASASVTWFSLSSEAPAEVKRAASAGGADVAIGVVAGARLRMSSRFAVTLSGALDVDLAPRTFVAHAGGERRVLAELPRLRPLLSLTATYSLLGPNRSRARAEVD